MVTTRSFGCGYAGLRSDVGGTCLELTLTDQGWGNFAGGGSCSLRPTSWTFSSLAYGGSGSLARMKKTVWGCGSIIAVALLFLSIGGCTSYNRLVSLSQNVEEKWAQVQTYYQRRADLIPNLVSTVSGAANFEKSTITQVVEARASVGQLRTGNSRAPLTAAELEQFEQAQSRLSSALSRLLVVVENYPDLKATANFRDLQAQLEGTENRIAVARRDFNEAVRQYNTAIKQFPTVLFAGLLGFSPKPYFQSAPGAEIAPRVQFDQSTPSAR